MTKLTNNKRERAARQRMLKTGKISYSDGAISTQCIIRDMSPTGARLQLVNDIPLPERFNLEIPSEGIVMDCFIRRRDGDQIGVSFESPIVVKESNNRQVVRPSVMRAQQTGILRRKAL
ncbi:MAG: PilZ domain-containing protein [Pseudomonadota bacterium]